ncbi:hypothetical protein ACE7GA_21380 [Roseomonas sp. CCTCC AB2023176]|uniref:hypothetical protein n=1 Tax=Roseomonas sp. CCTCC AB2023176 TaxID=3342640 RepID=UPI0035DDD8BA
MAEHVYAVPLGVARRVRASSERRRARRCIPITGAPIARIVLPPAVRAQLEDYVERALAILDAADGDPDFEPDDHDCCAAADDDLSSHPWRQRANDWAPGTPEDAEPDTDDEASCCATTLVPDWFAPRESRA